MAGARDAGVGGSHPEHLPANSNAESSDAGAPDPIAPVGAGEASVGEPVGTLEGHIDSKPKERKFGSRWAKKTVVTPPRTPNDRSGWLHGPDCRCSMLACRAERRNPPT